MKTSRVASIRLALLFVAMILAVGCAAERDSALKQDADQLTTATQQGDFVTLLTEAEGYWENRGDEAQLRKAIETWEKAVQTESAELSAEERKAKIAETYEKLSRAYYLLADSHIRLKGSEDDMADAMMPVYEKGVTAAEKALALRDPAFTQKIASGDADWEDAVSSADPAAAPALYWYSTNLGKWALLEGIATILSRKDDIKATMDWLEQTDPGYFHGAPARYFGVYHTKVPIGGGDPPKSKAAFERSLELGPNYQATKVLMANSYAVLVGDRPLFEQLLNEVVAYDLTQAPEIAPENALEQQKAKRLLANADDLFY